MAGKKDAAWWREYRRKQKEERQAHAGVATSPKTDVSSTLDMSTAAVHGYTCGLCPWGRDAAHSEAEWHNHMAHVHPDEWAAGVFEKPITPVAPRGQEKVRPSFLAAPDDDCAACGHDRQQYHLNAGGVCWAPAPNTRSRRCDCPSYVSAAEPF